MERPERDPDEQPEPKPEAEPAIEDNEDNDEPPRWDEVDDADRERRAKPQDEHPEW